MKVIEHLARAAEPPVSFEIIPPKRGGNLSSLLQLIGELAVFKPPFIDITSHPAEIMQIRTDNGSERRWVRRRPGTLGVCALVQHQ
ncbi:MAG: methylenetetrahydrofolate reductase [NAD(P)H], partial [Polyangiales bacterium]